MTDPQTASLLKKLGFEVFEIEVGLTTLLLDRSKGFLKFLENQSFGPHVILMDYDMLLLGRIDSFYTDSDLSYTLREAATRQPINGGIQAVRVSELTILHQKEIVSIYSALGADQVRWWGDQISLSEVLSRQIGQPHEGIYTIQTGRLKLFSTDIYNFTPFDLDVSRETLLRNLFIKEGLKTWLRLENPRMVLHFKGPRKHLQFQAHWELTHNASYQDFIVQEFKRSVVEIKRCGTKWLSEKVAEGGFSRYVSNDIAVLAHLNAQKLGMIDHRHDLIHFLKSSNDFRFKLLSGEHYAQERL